MSRSSAQGARRSSGVRRPVAGMVAGLVIAGVLPATVASPARAADGQGFTLNASDLRFILAQIQIAEAHVTTLSPENPCGTLLGTGPHQIPNQQTQGAELPWGLRTVDGTCNNLRPGQDEFGAADRLFPRRADAEFTAAQGAPVGFPPAASSSYAQSSGFVFDSTPRIASNLVVDQTAGNPAAVAAAGQVEPDPGSGTLFIPNTAPDVGLSAPYNSLFTLFGQFFDHGLDLTTKSGGTVFVPLQADDPLYVRGGRSNFMVLTRSTNQPGPDGVLGTPDDVHDATNQTTAFVDQSQTYTSHPAHQAFLREYTATAAGVPVATGRMLTGPGDGLATWGSAKAQARTVLGIDLRDADVVDVPLLATDPYGRFVPGPNGRPQLVVTDPAAPTGQRLVEGDPAAPVPTTGAVRTGHAFLDDIAHHAGPIGNHDGNPATPNQLLAPDEDPGTTDDRAATTYDDEMLDAHFVAGDGRINENIGLSAIHQIFHAEHNRLAVQIDGMIAADPALQAQWMPATPEADDWAHGERLFQAARFVAEMEYQHLAFEEFARKVQPMVNVFSGYDTSIDPAISAEFAHAVYRFGHSMLNETVARRSPTGENRDIALLDAFLNPPSYAAGGRSPEQASGDIVRGMTEQVGNEIDEFVTEALRSNLLGLPLDLATLNIARARETGVPPLNQARRHFFALTHGNTALAPYENWIDFGLGLRHPASLINFVAAYGTHPTVTGASSLAAKRAAAVLLVAGDPQDPATPPDAVDFLNGTGAYADAAGRTTTGLDDVDLWLGGLAERQAPFGGLLGSTFNVIFETEMENLQDGDRFYYLGRTAGLNLLVQLEGNSFAELISRNTDAVNLPADVFSRPDLTFDLAQQPTTGPIVDDPATGYDERKLLTRMTDGTIRYSGSLHVLFVGTQQTDRVRADEGDDTLRGNELDDRLEGGAGNDQLIGGSGRDVLTDSFGDDVLKGGDGNDAISSGPGLDLNQGGLGNDFLVGGSDPTETFGGPGDDIVYAGDSSDTVFGDDGDDWLEGGGQADLLQGDNGAPFQDDPNTPGHDVLDGNGGADVYDAEGGDDIMVAGPGIERNSGMLGFDWVTHKNDPQAADDDLRVSVQLPPAIHALRDRFDLVEGLSGGNLNDILRGDDAGSADLVGGNELDAAGIARIGGLAALLPAGATSFTGGNILLGGSGSDLLEGRGGDDVLDGDAWLDVALEAPGAAPVDSMSALRAAVFAGQLDPGTITIRRTIEVSPAGSSVDTALFTGPRSEYDVTPAAGGLIVAHVRGTAVDGVDTLRNVESLRFADGSVAAADLLVTAPGAPTITSVVAGNGQATVAFTRPASDGGRPITGFRVQVVTGGTATDRLTVIPATATRVVVNGLANGVSYTFRVRAVNAAGLGELSAPSAAVTPAITPAAPRIGRATAGIRSATVQWVAPAVTGGSPITEYQVQVRVNGVEMASVRGIAPTLRSIVVPGLANGTTYTFRVRAFNAIGSSPFSAASNAVTLPDLPGLPTTVVASSGTAGGAVTARVSWGAAPANGSPVTGYVVRALRLDGRGSVVATTTSPIRPAGARELSMALPAGSYRFTVQAVNAVGRGTETRRSNPVIAR
jgi:Ca2+-binding RTX toxin-like protein